VIGMCRSGGRAGCSCVTRPRITTSLVVPDRLTSNSGSERSVKRVFAMAIGASTFCCAVRVVAMGRTNAADLSRIRPAIAQQNTQTHRRAFREDDKREIVEEARGEEPSTASKAYPIATTAASTRLGGISRLNVLAALRLMTTANFVACSTGIFAG
jgi:hypothetical protein